MCRCDDAPETAYPEQTAEALLAEHRRMRAALERMAEHETELSALATSTLADIPKR